MGQDKVKKIKANGPIENAAQEIALNKSFITSWWFLFLLVPFLSLVCFFEFFELIKPYLNEIEPKSTRGNVTIIVAFVYFVFTIAGPAAVLYIVPRYLQKKQARR